MTENIFPPFPLEGKGARPAKPPSLFLPFGLSFLSPLISLFPPWNPHRKFQEEKRKLRSLLVPLFPSSPFFDPPPLPRSLGHEVGKRAGFLSPFPLAPFGTPIFNCCRNRAPARSCAPFFPFPYIDSKRSKMRRISLRHFFSIPPPSLSPFPNPPPSCSY